MKINFTILIIFFFIFSSTKILKGNNKQKDTIESRPVAWVNPFIDTKIPRWQFFSSACRPLGMVNLSPDTKLYCSSGQSDAGYSYNSDSIYCFSHIHDWQISGIAVLPVINVKKPCLGASEYKSKFDHNTEIAKAGYHKVILQTYGIQAELTATEHTGFHRYTFPASEQSDIIFNLCERLGPSSFKSAMIKQVSNIEVVGFVVTDSTIFHPKSTSIYFVVQVDKPFQKLIGWKDRKMTGSIDSLSGTSIGAVLRYSTSENEIVQMKIGISYVSIDQARLNLKTEINHWDFEKIKNETNDIWNQMLYRIRVFGSSNTQKTKFYTDLFHTLTARKIISDVNGRYCDQSGIFTITRQLPLDEKFKPLIHYFSKSSLWESQWNINLLWSLVYPDFTEDFINYLLIYYENSGSLPLGFTLSNNTVECTGMSATPLMVNAFAHGIRGYNVEKAYELLKEAHFNNSKRINISCEKSCHFEDGLKNYIDAGFFPYAKGNKVICPNAGSLTLELAYQDWCLAQFSLAMEKETDFEQLMKRSNNYKNIYDKSIQLMRPKNLNGSWVKPFEVNSKKGWTESNAFQSYWYVPQDVMALINLTGGNEKFNLRLNQAFENASVHHFISNHGDYKDQINYARQSNYQTGYLFNYSGAPWLSQKWVRSIKDKVLSGVSIDAGYCGAENPGTSSSLSVLMALGLFSVNGACAYNPVYEITSPVFDMVIIKMQKPYYSGSDLIIATNNNSAGNIYIQSIDLNEKKHNKTWFYLHDIKKGGIIRITLGNEPNKNLGSKTEDCPPSMTK